MSVLDPVVELACGLWTTLKMMVEKPVTYQYPEQKREVRPRFRGRHILRALRKRPGTVYWMFPVRGGLSSRCDLCRSGGEYR